MCCMIVQRSMAGRVDNYSENDLGRWERLLDDDDDSRVWRAIDWRGNFENDFKNICRPSDEEFKAHFESILNQPSTANFQVPGDTNVTIPILDDPISPGEVNAQIEKIKPNKACGPDGLSPGIFSLLPAQ